MLYVYPVISWLYLALPLIGLAMAVVLARRGRGIRPLRVFLRACAAGALLGAAVAISYGSVAGAALPLGQVLLTCYLAVGAVCVVLALNWLLSQLVSRLLGIDPRTGQGGCCKWAHIGAGALQAVLMILLALPYLGSVLLLYRPKSPGHGDPLTLLDAPFQTARFLATDGTRIDAWWVPARRSAQTDGRGSVKWGRDTVLLCHGFSADKAKDLFLARDLVSNGYNVLAIDLRAHGHSGGQFTAFGGVEARDVLGAVRWLRRTHADECHRILGLGESLGAVALIEAAADPSPEGQSIDAIAAYNPYDEFGAVVSAVAQRHTVRFGHWVFAHLVMPIGSAQVGMDLARLSPARAVRSLWPRPILVLGNPLSRDVLTGRSFNVYQSALQPKYSYSPEDEDRDALLHDKKAAMTVRIFFDEEQSIL